MRLPFQCSVWLDLTHKTTRVHVCFHFGVIFFFLNTITKYMAKFSQFPIKAYIHVRELDLENL